MIMVQQSLKCVLQYDHCLVVTGVCCRVIIVWWSLECVLQYDHIVQQSLECVAV